MSTVVIAPNLTQMSKISTFRHPAENIAFSAGFWGIMLGVGDKLSLLEQIRKFDEFGNRVPFSAGLRGMPPVKPKNVEVRAREYLLPDEVEALVKAAGKTGRCRQRDRALILLMYRHALRASEAAELRWHQVDWKHLQIHIRRKKGGKPSVQAINGDEQRLLKALRRKNPDHPFIFVGELGAPLSERSIYRIVQRAGEIAKLGFPVHPHMLRHGRGYQLAAQGQDTRAIQDYLGHQEIRHTVVYTELAPQRFQDWLD